LVANLVLILYCQALKYDTICKYIEIA